MIFIVVNNQKYLCVFEVIQQQQQLLFIKAVKKKEGQNTDRNTANSGKRLQTNLMKHKTPVSTIATIHPAFEKALGIVRAPTPIIRLKTYMKAT